MADGGGSSSAGAAAGSGAAAGAAAAGSDAGAGTGAAVATGSEAGENAGAEAGEGSEEAKISDKVGEVIDGKAVTVQDVKDKSTINKDHVEGEEKTEKEKTEEVKKHKYADRLSKEFPGREFKSSEEEEAGFDDYLKNIEGYRERGIVANQKLVALFEAEPQIADVISSMIGGATLRSALARHIGSEDLVPEEGDPDYKAWDENTKQRLERIEKTNKFNQEFNDNLEFSRQSVDAFATENNLKPEEAEKILGEFDNMLQDIYRGRITKETLAKIVRAVKHDEAVQEAKEEGEIKGKNEAVKAEKEKVAPKDDGLPVITGTGETTEETEERPEQATIIDRIFESSKKRSNF